jgi:hypothetical protein
MANENDWLVTAAEVGAEITQTTVAIDALDAVFVGCSGLTPAQQTAWASFKQQYDLFIDGVNQTLLGGISWAWQSNILAAARGWQATVVQWQQVAASQCAYTPTGPYVNQPPPPADSMLLTVLKWGAIAAVGAVAFVAIAPMVEAAIGSKAASVAASRAKAGIASSRRIYRRARGEKSGSSGLGPMFGR